MRPRVSVVIPAYNAEQWIGETINSVFNQRYPDIEIVVVDDCSTDKTWEILQEIKRTIPGNIKSFVTFRNDQNAKECRTSRKGFSLSTGDYICRLSADDTFVSSHHLEDQISIMEKWGSDWCYNSVNTTGVNPVESTTYKSSWFPVPRWFHYNFLQCLDNAILSHPYLAFLIVLFRNPVNSSTFMIRADSYRKYAQWSDKHWTDCDSLLLMKLLLCKTRGIAIHEIGAFYRLHPGQGSRSPEYQKEVIRIRKEVVDFIQTGNYPFWFKKASRMIMNVKYGR